VISPKSNKKVSFNNTQAKSLEQSFQTCKSTVNNSLYSPMEKSPEKFTSPKSIY